jgi:hypothetical protein
MAAGSQLTAPPGIKIGRVEGPKLQNRPVESSKFPARIHLHAKSSNKMEGLALSFTTSN